MTDNPAAMTADNLATWLTPRQALEVLSVAFTISVASDSIMERLRGGLISSVAANSSWESDKITTEPTSMVSIPASHWHYAPTDQASVNRLWYAGDVRFFLGTSNGRYAKSRAIRYFGIKFDPVGVRALLPPATTKSEQAEELPEASSTRALDTEEAPASKGPRVSEENLKAWYAVYQRTYLGPSDTLENAYQSARGMFPGKFVARDRVRKLCEGRKRGRKPNAENE
jgi:hypothetical protein